MTREKWWAFCAKNCLKLAWLPTFNEFCLEEFHWEPEFLMTKFRCEFSVSDKNVFVDLIRIKDNKTKRYTFIGYPEYQPKVVYPFKCFMSSLTDDQCEAMVKG